MPAWWSPFSLAPDVVNALSKAGWQRWHASLNTLPDDGVLVYDAPDRLIAKGLDALQAGYAQLQEASLAPKAVAVWRLLDSSGALPKPDPIAGALTLVLLTSAPGVLDAYRDLELKADLRGGELDVAYVQRLQEAVNPSALLRAWQKLQSDEDLQDAREEAELTLLQLHQVQEELEHYFLLSREQNRLLNEHQQLAAGLLTGLAQR